MTAKEARELASKASPSGYDNVMELIKERVNEGFYWLRYDTSTLNDVDIQKLSDDGYIVNTTTINNIPIRYDICW